MFRNGNERMIRSSGTSQYCPAVVMPIDYQVRISEETYYDCDEKGGYRGRILYEKPSRRLYAVAEGLEETPNLPKDFEGSCEDKGEGFRAEDGWWGR